VLLPALGSALITSLWRWRALAEIPVPGWKPVAAGLAGSVLLAGAAQTGGKALRDARSASRDAERKAAMASVPKLDPDKPYPKVFFQKGINFTAEGPDGYSPPNAARMLDQLRGKGVTAIALVPYGFQRREQTSIQYEGSWERAELIADVTALAHQRGMKVLLKPQIWIGRGFPGDIIFEEGHD